MKGLLITAFSLFLFGAAYAQDNKSRDRNDDENTTVSNPSGLDGAPMPGPGHRFHTDHPWNSTQIIALAPFQFSENGVGVGLSYERALDPDGIISFYVPFIATWNLNKNENNYNGTSYTTGQVNTMLYLMPGIKFYPTGMGRVKYAVGPSAVVGVGQKMSDNYSTYDPYYGYTTTYGTMQNRFLFGMMLNNSLNVNATPRLYIGAELGLGFSYFDRVNNINTGMTGLVQGSFKLGYTF